MIGSLVRNLEPGRIDYSMIAASALMTCLAELIEKTNQDAADQ